MRFIKFNINQVKFALLPILGMAFYSCSDTLDINQDPDGLTKVPIASLLTGSEVNLMYTLGGEASRMPASIVQYYAGHRGQPLEYAQYDITPSSTDRLWANLYQAGFNLKAVETESETTGDKIYTGIAQLLEAYTFSVTTDLFGDIPFSESLKGDKNINPTYDKQQAVYEGVLALIDKGIANVKSNSGKKPGNADLVYKGDVLKWEKFGNSLKLRMLNHLAKVEPTRALNFLNSNPILISSTTDEAKVAFGATNGNANPIYQFDEVSGRKDQAVASTIVNKMKAINDPRVSVYFKGVKNGAKAGQILGNVPGDDNDDSGELLFSRVGSAYASIGSPVFLISSAEVEFIKAEIYLRSGNNASAKTSYEKAISNDFASLGLSASYASYIALPEVAFDDSLTRLAEQKWITMFQAPFEAFSDWRRTGFPVLTVANNNLTEDVIPRRLPYCQTEINVNGNSLSSGPGIPATYVDLKNRVWWDKL